MTPQGEAAGAAVLRRPVAEPVAAPPGAPALAARAPVTSAALAPNPAAPPSTVSSNTQYLCVSDTDTAGEPRQTAIEFAPKVAQLCLKHPEMGPCQYERNLCRRSGGRVYAANGAEITRHTEDEYDKKVMRVRFQAN
jgi:hypothetical protein